MASRNKSKSKPPPVQRDVPPHDPPADERSVSMQHTSVFLGPLPSPDALQGYERVMPGLAERIVSEWEEEAHHRRSGEKRILDEQATHQHTQHQYAQRGRWFGFLIGVAGIAAGTTAALYDHEWFGTIVAGT